MSTRSVEKKSFGEFSTVTFVARIGKVGLVFSEFLKTDVALGQKEKDRRPRKIGRALHLVLEANKILRIVWFFFVDRTISSSLPKRNQLTQ